MSATFTATFSTSGTFHWFAPPGVTSASWTCAGSSTFNGTGTGSSSSLTPGTSYTVVVVSSATVVVTWSMSSPVTLVHNTSGGVYQWTAPAGTSSVAAAAWGAGGGGGGFSATTGGGSGGGAGEYAEDTPAVTGGSSYPYAVGAAGAGSATTTGGTGSNSTFAGDSVTVTAHAGTGGASSGGTVGAGGSGSTNTNHHSGGSGGLGVFSGTFAEEGGGGGGSGGTAAAGNNGTAGSSGVGGAGASAVTGGGPGGAGGAESVSGSAPPSGPGGGGGGMGRGGTIGGAGWDGQLTLTWSEATPIALAESGAATDVIVALNGNPFFTEHGSGSAALSINKPVLPLAESGHASEDFELAKFSQFPQAILPLKVEMLVGTAWTDVSSYTYQRTPVVITRGRPDESTTANPGNCVLELNNQDGRFSPRNPLSPYYGQIGRNTQMRVSVGAISATSQPTYRFWGEVSSWPPQWDNTGKDVSVPLTISGILQRLSQQKAIVSPLTAYYQSLLGSSFSPVAWWPMEDISGSSSLASGIAGGQAMNFTAGAPSLSSDTSIPGSSALPTWASATALGFVSGAAIADASSPTEKTYTDTYYSNGTWTCPSGVFTVDVICIGGGGGGGGANGSHNATGGGAGGTSQTLGMAVTPGLSYPVTVGGGGNRGVFGGSGAGAGGDTSFSGDSDTCTGSGGAGGGGGAGSDGAGGSGTLSNGGHGGNTDSSTDHGTGGGGTGNQNCVFNSKTAAGNGGDGGNSNSPYGGNDGDDGGGGGGGGRNGTGSSFGNGGNGGSGIAQLQYTQTIPGTGGAGSATESANVLRFVLSIPVGGGTDDTELVRLYTSGTVAQLSVFYRTGGNLELVGYDSSGATKFDSGSQAFGADGVPLIVTAELQVNGSGATWVLGAVQALSTSAILYSGSVSSVNIGDGISVTINPAAVGDSTVVGQVSVTYATSSLLDVVTAFGGFEGETACARFSRLLAQFGISAYVPLPDDGNDSSALMGPQTAQNLLALLQECETCDGGLIYEPITFFGLGYLSRTYLTDPTPAVTLNYTAAHLAFPLQPVEDDQHTLNDITVSRVNGSSARQYLASGRLSINDPPNGVGQYSSSVTVNCLNDGQLNDIAGWLLYRGTIDSPRYPVINVDLSRSEVSSLLSTLDAVDIGALVDITNTPSWLPPEDIQQLVYGTTETLSAYTWSIAWNCVPADPFLLGLSDDPVYGRVDTTGSSLHSSCTAGATTISVSSTDEALWTTSAGDFPFDIAITGERLTVTNITGTSSPQTFTVTRSVNGISKAHSAGDDVRLWTPSVVDF